MDYGSWIIARDALELCGHAKDVLKRLGRSRIVGTYYGYTFFLNANGESQWRGHFALREILENNRGRIDFLLSPQSYGQRRLGDTCGEMKPFATLVAAGIMPIVEDDTRTHNRIYPQWRAYHQTHTPEQTASVVARNSAIRLCQGEAPYLYGLTTGYEYNSPECAKVGRAVAALHGHAVERNVGRRAEVALVASERSVTAMPNLTRRAREETGDLAQEYLNDGTVRRSNEVRPVFNGEVFNGAHTKFARSGASIDYLLAEDLKRHSGDYKVYVFLNVFVYDDEFLAVVEKLRRRGATLLWLYAPGYLNANSLSDMEKLVGMKFKLLEKPEVAAVRLKEGGRMMGMPKAKVAKRFSPIDADEVLGEYVGGEAAVARKKVGGGEVYFSGTWQLDVDFIVELLRRSGVHIYSDSRDPMEANEAIYTLHARTPGLKMVRLPVRSSVVDVLNGRLLGRGVSEFSFDASLHSTHLFYFGKDAEILLKKLRDESSGR
jgi:hypothetical protein